MDAHAVEARELVPAPVALHQQHHDAKVDPELFDLLVHGERLDVRGRVDVVREVRDAHVLGVSRQRAWVDDVF